MRTGLLALLGAIGLLGQTARIKEASGVVRSGADLLVADDAEIGAYYRVRMPPHPERISNLNALQPERVVLKSAGLGVDIEGIGVLADGRVALLSERLRSLVSDDGVIAEYDSDLAETSKRGLEGLTIRPLGNGKSRIAVLWEGGYPDVGEVALRLRPNLMRGPSLPLILIHDLNAKGRAGRVLLRDALSTIELQVPTPAGKEPEAQRFRAPDLCWTRIKGEWGFVVLLSSQSGVRKPTFEHHWLQRFNLDGQAVGEPLDIAKFAPPNLGAANWEGVNWWEPGKSLVLVHEGQGRLDPHALLIGLPPEWQFRE